MTEEEKRKKLLSIYNDDDLVDKDGVSQRQYAEYVDTTGGMHYTPTPTPSTTTHRDYAAYSQAKSYMDLSDKQKAEHQLYNQFQAYQKAIDARKNAQFMSSDKGKATALARNLRKQLKESYKNVYGSDAGFGKWLTSGAQTGLMGFANSAYQTLGMVEDAVTNTANKAYWTLNNGNNPDRWMKSYFGDNPDEDDPMYKVYTAYKNAQAARKGAGAFSGVSGDTWMSAEKQLRDRLEKMYRERVNDDYLFDPEGGALHQLAERSNELYNWQQERNQTQTEFQKMRSGNDKAWDIANQLVIGTAQAVPYAAFGMLGAAGAAGGEIGAQLSPQTTGILNKVAETLQSFAKSPDYWLAFTQETGNTYREALDAGASQDTAALTATLVGLINGAIEIGMPGGNGGIQDLPERLIKNGKGSRKAIQEWVESSVAEGKEEILQGIISNLAEKLGYNKAKAWTGNEGVFDVNALAKEGFMGMAVGGILGGGQAVGVSAYNRSVQNRLNEQYAATGARFRNKADTIIENALNLPETTEAYKLAQELKSRQSEDLDEEQKSKLYSNEEIGRLYSQTMRDTGIDYNPRADALEAIENRLKHLGETSDTRETAQLVLEAAERGVLSSVDKSTKLKNSKYGQRVLNEFRDSELIPQYDSEWADKLRLRTAEKAATPELTQAERGARIERLERVVNDNVNPAEKADIDTLAEKYGAQANVFKEAAKAVEGTDIYYFDDAYHTVYQLAKSGLDESTIRKDMKTSWLSPSAFQVAYKAGQAAQTTKSGTRYNPNATLKLNGINYKSLNNKQRASVRALMEIARVTGINIELFDSTMADGTLGNEQGSYVNGKIRIDINAGMLDKGDILNVAMLRTASHELTHYIQQNNKDAYKELKDFVFDKLQIAMFSDGKYKDADTWIRAKMDTLKLEDNAKNYDIASDEVIADACEMMLKDSTAFETLAKENPSLARRLLDWLKGLIADIKKAFSGVEAASTEAKAMVDSMEELQKKWDAALVGAVQNTKETESNQQSETETQNSIRFDSTGKELTDAQAKYFENSKVRDEQGRLLVMYHGTPNAGFTKFRSGSYFTQHREWANVYQSPSASSISAGKQATNPDTYAVYLNITKPFDTRNAKERNIFYNEYYRKWGMGSDLTERGLPDWLDGMDLQEFLEENGYDYDGLILDEGGVGGYGEDVIDRGLSYVTFSAEQVKNIDNLKPTKDEDIRYSTRVTPEQDKRYMELAKDPQKNEAELRKMVDEAADAAGYRIVAYHGSRYHFNAFSKQKRGLNTQTQASKQWFFAGDFDTANSYYPLGAMAELIKQNVGFSQKDIDRMENRGIGGELYALRLKMENPLIVDVSGYDYAAHAKNADAFMEYVRQADVGKRDGIILLNVRDNNLKPSAEESTIYLFKEPSQAKRADPVTYDDNGNVIPLSERFNEEDEDIRYSRRPAQVKRDAGEKLTESEFYSLYSAHKIYSGNDVEATIKGIRENGFQGDGGLFGQNLTPTYMSYIQDKNGNVRPSNISEARYAPRKGETILLVPKSGAEINKRYDRVKPGYRPAFDYEIVTADYDYQPYYEMYSKAYDADVQYSTRAALGDEYENYQRRAIVTEETIDDWISSQYFGATNPKYAQAYIAYITPEQFLKLTTSSSISRMRIRNEAEGLSISHTVKASKRIPIQLEINTETGEVIGHEGRHRMVALSRAGVRQVPILLFDQNTKYSKEPLASLDLTGQDFGTTRSDEQATIYDLEPLSSGNRETILAKFSTPTVNERLNEKYIEPQVKFQLREQGLSAREILSTALTDVAQTEAERDKLKSYQRAVKTLDETQARLDEVRQEIHSIMFTAGSDRSNLKALETEKADLEKTLNRWDKRLMSLQNTAPLRAVLERERARVRKQTREEIMENVRDKRETSAVRKSIKNLMEKWNSKLQSDTPARNIPAPFKQAIAELSQAMDLTSGRPLSEKAVDKLNKLKSVYDLVMNDDDFKVYQNPIVKMYVDNAVSIINNTPLRQMGREQLEALYDAMKCINSTMFEANKLRDKAYRRDLAETGRAMITDTTEAIAPKWKFWRDYETWQLTPRRFFAMLGGWKKNSAWEQVAASFQEGTRRMLRYERDFYNNFRKFTEAPELDRLTNPHKLIDIGLVGKDGNPVKITRGMMLSIYMHLLSEDNRRAVLYGGFNVPVLAEYYGQKIAESYTTGHENVVGILEDMTKLSEQIYQISTDKSLTDEEKQQKIEEIGKKQDALEEEGYDRLDALKNRIYNEMTDFEKQLTEAATAWNDGNSQNYINEVTMAQYQIKRAKVKNYWAIHRDTSFVQTDFESIAKNMNLANVGWLKDRVKSATPVLLTDFVYEMDNSCKRVATFYGYAIAQADFNKLYNYKIPGVNISVQDEVRSKFGGDKKDFGVIADQYVENFIGDVVGSRLKPDTSIWAAVRRNLPRATLTLNPRVALSQIASVPTAAAEVGWGNMAKGFFRGLPTAFNKNAKEELMQKDEYFFQRYRGDGSMREFADMKSGNNIIDKLWNKADKLTKHALLNWCQNFDVFATATMWAMAEEWVKSNTNLTGEAFEAAVKQKYDDIITNTQPNYTKTERSDLLRDTREAYKFLTMYKTQSNQNFNILKEANARLRKTASDYKNGKNGVTKADLNEARKRFANAYSAVLLGGSLAFVALRALANALLGHMNDYRDDDDEITKASVLNGITVASLQSMANMFVLGSEVEALVEKSITGKKYYGLEDTALASANNVLKQLQALAVAYATGETDDIGPKWAKLTQNAAQIVGLPYSSVKTFIEAGKTWAKDIERGTFGSYEGAVERSNKVNYNRLYKALEDGNTAKADSIREEIHRNSPDIEDNTIDSGLRNVIKGMWEDGVITSSEAVDKLVEYTGKDKDTAYWDVQKWSNKANAEEDEKYTDSNYYRLWQVIDNDGDADAAMSELLEHGKDANQVAKDIRGHIKDEFVAGTLTEKEAADKLYRYGTHKDNGKQVKYTVQEANEIVAEWLAKQKLGWDYDDKENLYKNGEISKSELKQAMISIGGYTNEKADEKITVYDWQNEGYDDITYASIKEYNGGPKSAGVSHAIWYKYWLAEKSTQADYKANGDTIPYSKMIKVFQYIGNLNITNDQKYALAKTYTDSDANIAKYKTW